MTPDLTGFLSHARWFGGKGRDFTVSGTRRLGLLSHDQPRVVVDVVTVTYAEGDSEDYQLPLSCYDHSQDRLEHARIGEWDDPDLGHVVAYDAIHDRDAMAHYLDAFAKASDDGSSGRGLEFHRVPGHELATDVHSTAFTGEQSNSSVMFGEEAMLKLFRKVVPGENPDITVHDALTRAGSEHIAHLYGWVGSGPVQLGMLQQFLRTASDGWETALASVRNLFAEADLHADEVGGDFAAEAGRLGEALAEVHHALADAFPTGPLDVAGLAAGMRGRLDAAVEVVPELAAHRAPLEAAYDALAGLDAGSVQRIHGDLHLGQTLRTSLGWKIVDFEGEPAKPLAERLAPDSVWRDVAGMLRSFDYAPHVVMRTAPEIDESIAHQREFRAGEWTRRNTEAFLRAYAGASGMTPEEQTLMSAYVADKAVYECVYEARNRPSWVSIPLAAIEGLTR